MNRHDVNAKSAEKLSWYTESYVQILVLNISSFVISFFVSDAKILAWVIVVPTVLVSMSCLVLMIKRNVPWANPVSLYIVVWLLLVPLTSFEAPLMEPMTAFEWQMCAGFGITYSFAGLLVTWKKPIKSEDVVTVYRINIGYENALLGLIGVSILALLFNFALGGIALFTEENDLARKTLGFFPGYSILSSLGSVGVALLANHYKLQKPKIYLFFTLSFISLQALTGSRFVAIITLIMTGVLIASHKLGKRHLRFLLFGGICVLIVFAFVASFRSSTEHMEQYFISSGIYHGEVSDLTSTEFVRYFGMSQRNMSTVLSGHFVFSNVLECTLSPITFLFRDVPDGLETSIYGYTANNIISYAYHDAGWLLWLVLFVWSLAVNIAFVRYSRNKQSLSRSYMWTMMAMSLTMSFFAYLNAYVYWIVLFAVLVKIIELFFSKSRKVSCTHTYFVSAQQNEVYA